MKDEHQVRIEALKLTQMVGGIGNAEGRIQFAAKFEQYILHGYSGEAVPLKPAPQAQDDAPTVPVTAAKGRRGGRTKAASEVPAPSGEASEDEQEGEIDPDLMGRPSSRVGGVSV